MTDNKIADIRKRAENGLMDVASQISRGDYSLGLIKARQVMEQIVRGYAKNYNIEYTDLAGTIENLYLANAISNEDREGLHEIRTLGNRAVQESYDDAQDAEKSYYILKHEIELYLGFLVSLNSRAEANDRLSEVTKHSVAEEMPAETAAKAERAAETPVKGSPLRKREPEGIEIPETVRRERRDASGSARRASQQRKPAQGRKSSRPDRAKAMRNDQRGGQHRGTRNSGGNAEVVSILKILVPIICIILLIILIKSIIPNKPKESETQTTPVVTETMTVPETPAPETPAAEPETKAPVRYKVSGDTVNVRYADNQDRIYEQLSKGTEIGEVEEIEGSDFVKFERDGIKLVVNKNYITPIEE